MPPEWKTVNVENVCTFGVPPDARAQEVQPIDSIFGMLRGEGYEVIYDYGNAGEDLDASKDQPGFTKSSRNVDRRAATEVSFTGEEGSLWSRVRILQIEDDRNWLTIRVSCVIDDECRLAQDVFDSMQFVSRN